MRGTTGARKETQLLTPGPQKYLPRGTGLLGLCLLTSRVSAARAPRLRSEPLPPPQGWKAPAGGRQEHLACQAGLLEIAPSGAKRSSGQTFSRKEAGCKFLEKRRVGGKKKKRQRDSRSEAFQPGSLRGAASPGRGAPTAGRSGSQPGPPGLRVLPPVPGQAQRTVAQGTGARSAPPPTMARHRSQPTPRRRPVTPRALIWGASDPFPRGHS